MSCLQQILFTVFGFALVQSVASINTQSAAGIGLEDILYVFFESPTVYSKHNLEQTAEIFKNPKFDPTLPNALYVHGYLDSPYTPQSRMVLESYFKVGGFNVFGLDWSSLAGNTYTNAVTNAQVVGQKLGDLYVFYFNNGIKPENTLVVGHDIGAHLLGQTGRTVMTNSNGAFKLPRITGLDPAYYLYYPPVAGIQHISRSDATYVDIIHTDAGGYGTPRLTGTADFFVNTGRRIQPGCPIGTFLPRSDNDLCSHRRAIQLWAESVSSTFTATMFGNPLISSQMGFKSPVTTTPGKYVVLTNSAAPFSRG